jgi:hypothetical protein
MWNLWWTKWHWGTFSPSTSDYPASLHSTNCPTITNIYQTRVGIIGQQQTQYLVNSVSPHLLTHGAEPFFRSRQICSRSRISQHFIELEGSLPCSQEPPLVPILGQIDPIHIIPFCTSKIHFNIVHSPTPWPSQWSLSFWLSNQNPICIPRLLH